MRPHQARRLDKFCLCRRSSSEATTREAPGPHQQDTYELQKRHQNQICDSRKCVYIFRMALANFSAGVLFRGHNNKIFRPPQVRWIRTSITPTEAELWFRDKRAFFFGKTEFSFPRWQWRNALKKTLGSCLLCVPYSCFRKRVWSGHFYLRIIARKDVCCYMKNSGG